METHALLDQAFNLIGDLTVYENVEFPLTYRNMPASERRKAVVDALERVGMSHRSKRYPSRLSGGQQQRVGEAVMKLMEELHAGGATICMVTHDPRFARCAERSIRLFDGRIVEEHAMASASAPS